MKKNVLLIHPSTHWKYMIFPMGLFYLGSFLEKQSNVNSVEIINQITQNGIPLNQKGLDEYGKKTKSLLESKNFDIVGISCWTSDFFQSSIFTAKLVREVNKDAIIAVGGYHPSVRPTDFQFQNSPFDYVVVGEGESPFRDYVLKGSIQKKPLIIENKIPIDLELLSELNWDLLEKSNLSNWNFGNIYLSRGCPFNCAFCMEKSKSHFKWRVLSPERSIELIQDLINHYPKVETISIFDPIFAFRKKWRKKFLNLIGKEQFNKNFWAEMRVDSVDKEDIQNLSKLNFIVYFGVENTSKRILKIMKKTSNPDLYLESVKKISKLAEQFQLKWICQFLVGHPGETLETIEENKKFITENFKKKEYWIPNIDLYRFCPGSHISEHLSEYEDKFGTYIKYPEWWKMPPMYQDFYSNLANRNKPSSNLSFRKLVRQYHSLIKLFKLLKRDYINLELREKMNKALQTFQSTIQNKSLLDGTEINRLYDPLGTDRHELLLI